MTKTKNISDATIKYIIISVLIVLITLVVLVGKFVFIDMMGVGQRNAAQRDGFVSQLSPFQSIPNVPFDVARMRLPYVDLHDYRVFLESKNIDRYGTEHTIMYGISFKYEVLEGFSFDFYELDEFLASFFSKFLYLFNDYAYEDFVTATPLFNVINEMKIHAQNLENTAGLRVFFGINGLLYSIESVLYASLSEATTSENFITFMFENEISKRRIPE